jgi:hypothetical protein
MSLIPIFYGPKRVNFSVPFKRVAVNEDDIGIGAFPGHAQRTFAVMTGGFKYGH